MWTQLWVSTLLFLGLSMIQCVRWYLFHLTQGDQFVSLVVSWILPREYQEWIALIYFYFYTHIWHFSFHLGNEISLITAQCASAICALDPTPIHAPLDFKVMYWKIIAYHKLHILKWSIKLSVPNLQCILYISIAHNSWQCTITLKAFKSV